MTKTERRIEFFRRYCLFFLAAHMEGIRILPYTFHRSQTEQDRLYADGKTKVKKSKHKDWMAIDGAVYNKDDGSLEWNGRDERYKRLHDLAETLGLETGYKWLSKDSNHTQWHNRK